MRRQTDEKKYRSLLYEEEREMTHDLVELQMHLDHYSVKYPDETTINNAIEQLRLLVPEKKRIGIHFRTRKTYFFRKLLTRHVDNIYRIFPVYRLASISLLLIGCLLLPNKLT